MHWEGEYSDATPQQGHCALHAARNPSTCFQIMVSGGGTETRCSLMHMVYVNLNLLGFCTLPTLSKIWGKDLNSKESHLFFVFLSSEPSRLEHLQYR